MLKKLKRFFYEENFTHNINLCIMKVQVELNFQGQNCYFLHNIWELYSINIKA